MKLKLIYIHTYDLEDSGENGDTTIFEVYTYLPIHFYL